MGPGSAAGIYSPAVVIFKDDLDHDCVDLPVEERRVVAVLTVAAPCSPYLSPDGETLRWKQDLDYFREKIRLVYRMAARNGKEYLVLGKGFRCLLECSADDVLKVLWDVVHTNVLLAR